MKGSKVTETKEDIWRAVRGIAVSRVCRTGTILFRQGEMHGMIYRLDKGLVKTICTGNDGVAVITGLRAPQWLLGAEAAIRGIRHQVTAIAAESCELTAIPAPDFIQLLQTDRAVSWYLHQQQSFELADLLRREIELRTLSPRDRFTRYLCRLLSTAQQLGSVRPVEIEIPLKQHEMAQLLAVSPEHLSRVVKQMEAQGMIQRNKRSLTVIDPRALERSLR